MRKISDRMVLGMVSGTVGTLVAYILDYGLYKLGLDAKTWPMRATGLSVSKKYAMRKSAKNLGAVTMLALGGLCGVGQAFMYSALGKDYLYAKSVGFGVLTWMGLHGVGARLSNSFDLGDSTPETAISSLALNITNAVVTSKLIDVLGDERLFRYSRDTRARDQLTPASLDRAPADQLPGSLMLRPCDP